MHRVLLIDDDVAVVQFLGKMICWEEHGLQLSGTCTNAYDALEHCRESMPDLIVTDIGMPGMDGIELIKAVKELSPRPRFVILSCHDEFRYAQQAVQMGVEDYILKETLEPQSMVELLTRIKEKMNKEDEFHSEVQKLHLQAYNSKASLKEKWLRDLLATPVSGNPSWMRQLEGFGFQPLLPMFIPVVCRLHCLREALSRYEKKDTVKFIVENAVEELLKNEPDVLLFSYSSKEFCFLFNCRKELKMNPYERIADVCRNVQQKLSQVLKLPVSMLLGEMAPDLPSMKRQVAQLLKEAEWLFYAWEPKVVKLSELVRTVGATEEPLVYYYEYADRLHRFILEGNSDASTAVRPFIGFISERRFSPKAVKQFVFKLVLDMMLKLKFNPQYTNEKLQRDLDQLTSITELERWLVGFVRDAVTLMEQISQQSKKVEIVEAQKYVRLHVDHKITLEEVADHLHLNPSYFSRLFKKETGETFIEYVTRVKMEEAKELLNGSDKTLETISRMLGYENKGYFVKVFKQYYGVIPSQFVYHASSAAKDFIR
ncbi:response regulator [Paenibacillus cremeus]|uniref:Response regulator n=1 Tax=Paenibacillus cremeus TaxID=2163881 RepID=A0A559KBG2_9BACL|nr:response regulator [Paenibacillus cremeus]TVY09470.1 response regulator [Paenibacillus cremeus]